MEDQDRKYEILYCIYRIIIICLLLLLYSNHRLSMVEILIVLPILQLFYRLVSSLSILCILLYHISILLVLFYKHQIGSRMSAPILILFLYYIFIIFYYIKFILYLYYIYIFIYLIFIFVFILY
jgi:hypothetical protein